MSLLWPVASPVLWFKEICRASNAVTVELDGGVRKEKSLVLLQYNILTYCLLSILIVIIVAIPSMPRNI